MSIRQKPSSHQSIEPPMPITRRMGGSAGSPKGSVQSSTPFASIIRSVKAPLLLFETIEELPQLVRSEGLSSPHLSAQGDRHQQPANAVSLRARPIVTYGCRCLSTPSSGIACSRASVSAKQTVTELFPRTEVLLQWLRGNPQRRARRSPRDS